MAIATHIPMQYWDPDWVADERAIDTAYAVLADQAKEAASKGRGSVASG